MKQTLVADIEAFVKESEARMLAVVRLSLDDMINDMQTPTAKGGRMRVDTGFLRASGRGSLEGFPAGPNQKPAGAQTGQYTGHLDTYDGSALNAVLLNMKLDDTFYWGWVAAYAPTREVYDGFMDTAIQNWQSYVNANSEQFRGR
jgi:hypothetical protein